MVNMYLTLITLYSSGFNFRVCNKLRQLMLTLSPSFEQALAWIAKVNSLVIQVSSTIIPM